MKNRKKKHFVAKIDYIGGFGFAWAAEWAVLVTTKPISV